MRSWLPTPWAVTRLAVAAVAAAAVLSCFGKSEQRVVLDREPQGGDLPTGGNLAPPPLGLRRLLAANYRRAIRDLLGPEAAAKAAPPPDVAVNGFRAIGAAQLALAPSAVDAYERSAVAVAEEALGTAERRERILGCTPSAACMESFVASFGRRAFRRALDAEALAAWTALGNQVAALAPADFTRGATAVIAGMLQSPNFLYLVEVGEPDPERPGVQRLTGTEVAARMALFLQGSVPDEALLAAAEAGELDTASGVRHHAWRLLLGPGAREALRDFLDEHLRLEGLAALPKDPVAFPQYSAALGASMREETLRLWESVVWEGDRDVRQVFTARDTFVDGPLADLYGVPRPPGGSGPVELPAGSLRAGFLGHASFLALNAHPGLTSPTYRGLFVRERLLCETVDQPPGNVNTSLPPPEGAVTMRDRLLAHRQDPACAGCHVLMDDIGLGLENFDALGQFRTTDQGVEIDASANVDGKAFAGAAALGELLAVDPRTSRCLQRSLFRYAVGHVETPGETLAMVELERGFSASGYRLRQLLADLVSSEAFRKGGAAP